MNKIFTLLVGLVCFQFGFLNAQSCSGNITLNTQLAVDTFNCPTGVYEGSITVSGAGITNLNALSGLKIITGSFKVRNTSIVNLPIFNQLDTIGIELEIEQNPNLRSVSFPNLKVVSPSSSSGFLELIDNPLLDQINFPQLIEVGNNFRNSNSVGQSLRIIRTGMRQLNGFPNLKKVSNRLHILQNAQLEQINGFSALDEYAHWFLIEDNPLLTEVKGFQQFKNVGFFNITNNDALIDISGFANL